jgi:hypothetical protein
MLLEYIVVSFNFAGIKFRSKRQMTFSGQILLEMETPHLLNKQQILIPIFVAFDKHTNREICVSGKTTASPHRHNVERKRAWLFK